MKRNFIKIIALMLAFMLLVPCIAFASEMNEKTVLYVAKDGSDANNGSINTPFASLEKARDTIRTMKAAGTLGKGGAVVYIRGGEYVVSKTFNLTKEDSGTAEAPIVYRNYPDEEVKFIGGAAIPYDKFKKVEDQNVLNKIVDEKGRENVVEADLFALGFTSLPEPGLKGKYSYNGKMVDIIGKTKPAAIEPELIINGEAMTVARYPNEGYMNIESILEPGQDIAYWGDDKRDTAEWIPPEKRDTTPFTVVVNDDRLQYWTDTKEALLTGCFQHAWADVTVPLASVDVTKKAITSKYPIVFSVKVGGYFYIDNLIEEIDSPGEYFVDREAGKLYLYPPSGRVDEVLYTTLDENMIYIDGAQYITIKGIDMAYTRSGGVKAWKTTGCRIVGCDISFTGDFAVYVDGSENKVYDCNISDVNQGIFVDGGNMETLTQAKNVVENNNVTRADRITKTYSSAIKPAGVGQYIYNNKMSDADHLLLQMFGMEHTIAFNEFSEGCQAADDMGAFYCGRSLIRRGNKVYYNYFHDIGGQDLGANGVHGIFLDDYFSAVTMKGNVFENITGCGVMFAGSHNEVLNNVFVNCQTTAGRIYPSDNYGASSSDVTFRDEIAASPFIYSDLWLSKYPSLANVIDKDNKLDFGNDIVVKDNLIYNSPDFAISNAATKSLTNEGTMIFKSDPGFYDLENRNYLLKEKSEVYTKNPNFQPILFTRMGQYSDRAINRVKNANVLCADSPYTLKNGKRVKGEQNAATFINESLYVPVRIGADAVGSKIDYDENTNVVNISAGGTSVSFANGGTDSVNANGVSQPLGAPIVHIGGTNYIAVEDLAKLFGVQLVKKGNIAVISSIENLFTDVVDDGLLRYIEEQITVY